MAIRIVAEGLSYLTFAQYSIIMAKRKNQQLIESDSEDDSASDSGSDLDSVSELRFGDCDFHFKSFPQQVFR